MMKRRMRQLLAVLLVLACLLVTAGCGSSEPDPNAGVYSAYTAEMMGLKIAVEKVYPDGFSIELKNNGKCTITIGDQSANGKWTLEGDKLSVSGGGVELEGTLANSLMTFDDVMDSGVTMTFLLEGAEAPAYTSAEEIIEALEDAAAAMEAAS